MTGSGVLLPYQQRWTDDKSRVRIAVKSRRVGLSWTVACEAALEGIARDGNDTWYIGYNLEMAREFILDVGFWARTFASVNVAFEEGVWKDPDAGIEDADKILTFSVRFDSGYRVTALSSRPRSLRGKKGHIIIDEAAHHEDLKGLLKAAGAVVMWGGKSRIDIISSHNGVESQFNEILEEVAVGKRPYSVHRIPLDLAIRDGLFRRICDVNGWGWTSEAEAAWVKELEVLYGDDAAEELYCVPARSGGVYISRDLVEKQQRPGPVFRLTVDDAFTIKPEAERVAFVDEWLDHNALEAIDTLDRSHYHFFGEDFGRTSDRSVVVFGDLAQNSTRRSRFSIEMANVPYDQQRQVLFYVVEKLPRFFFGTLDATGNGGALAEAALQKWGPTRIECVKITDLWYAEHLPKFRRALVDGKMELLDDVDHTADLGAFRTINGTPKLPAVKTKSKSGGKPRHGDAGVAYLMAFVASSKPLPSFEFNAVESYRPPPVGNVAAIKRDPNWDTDADGFADNDADNPARSVDRMRMTRKASSW